MNGSVQDQRETLDADYMYHQLEDDSFREDNEQHTAWRQQTVLASGLMDVPMDLMEYRFLLPVELNNYNQCVNSINDVGLKVLQFPKLEDVGYAGQNEFEVMFESQAGVEQASLTSRTTRDVSRNTMEHFLNGQSNRAPNGFHTAREVLALQTMKKYGNNTEMSNQRKAEGNESQTADFSFTATKKTLGSLGRVVSTTKKGFVPPVRGKVTSNKDADQFCEEKIDTEKELLLSHAALKNVDPKMVEVVNNEIMHTFKPVDWNEIAGLDYAKSIIKEAVVYPLLRPDIFTGLRRPPRGILLFGPPGTGKTLIGKCIASQSRSTFFSISSASLTSKWMGEGEKMVRALFAVAVARQPSVIFMDEIDSLLSKRSENENEGTRRLKTEFLVRLDGAATSDDDRVLIVGATNRPQELDEAVRRRFVKRLYVPLPERDARVGILTNLLKTVANNLDVQDLQEIANLADGYSGADMHTLCHEASMEPVRSTPFELIQDKDDLPLVNKSDFYTALKKMNPSVSQSDLDQYVEWNKTYGSSF